MRMRYNAIATTCAAIVLGFVVAFGTAAFAKKPDKPTQAASVIAHLPLEGAAASQMYLQVQGDKRYLYVDQGTDQGYTVVDVTRPAQPNIIKRTTSGKLQVVGSDLALAEAPESKTVARGSIPTQSVTVVDTSDPANPKNIQTFQGVTSLLQDNGRGLIFLTNNDGLWILRHTAATMRPSRRKPPCNSESAISAMPPDCE